MEHEKKPLTLDQLRQMDGQPVWIEDEERFGLVSVAAAGAWKGIPFVRFCENGCGFEYNVETRGLKLYACKPINFDKWEPCEHCRPSTWPPDMFGPHDFPVVDNAIYYYDVDDGWEGEEINFCPWCGRPLTPAARELLERRLRG